MSGAKGRNRIEKRLVDMSASAEQDARQRRWVRDLDDPPNETEWVMDLGPTGYLVVREVLDRDGDVVDFAMMQFLRGAAGEYEICRYDTAHDELHIHYFTQAGTESRESMFVLESVHDVKRAWDEAYNRILSEWEDNEGRWHG